MGKTNQSGHGGGDMVHDEVGALASYRVINNKTFFVTIVKGDEVLTPLYNFNPIQVLNIVRCNIVNIDGTIKEP